MAAGGASAPYDLAVLEVEITDEDPAELLSEAVDEPLTSTVDLALQTATALPAEEALISSETEVVEVRFGEDVYRISRSGEMYVGVDRCPLRDLLLDSYVTMGWQMFDDLSSELNRITSSTQASSSASNAASIALDVLQIVQGVESSLSQQIADFLLSFEDLALTVFDEALSSSEVAVRDARSRYLQPKTNDEAPALKLKEQELDPQVVALKSDLDVVLGVRDAMHEHQMFYAPLSGMTLVGRALDAPIRLATLMPVPSPIDTRSAFGPVIGPELASWFEGEIRDYVKGRDALLRALSMYIFKARSRHPILEHLVRRVFEKPSNEVLATHIDAICTEVDEAIQSARSMRGSGRLAALGFVESLPLMDRDEMGRRYIPPLRAPIEQGKSLLEQSGFEQRRRPEVWLGQVFGRKTHFSAIDDRWALALPNVTVWDLDGVYAQTRQRLWEQGRLGSVEETALRLMQAETTETNEIEGLWSVGLALSLGTLGGMVAGPVGTAAVGTTLSLISVVAEHRRFSTLQGLAQTEALEPFNHVHRILLREPSAFELLQTCIALVGDVAGVLKFQRMATLLFRSHLLLIVLSAVGSVEMNIKEIEGALGEQRQTP